MNEGESITLPSGSGLSRSDYTFGGWNTNADGTGTNYNADSSYTVTGNITLYAKWDTLESVTGLANKLTWLRANAKSDTSYTIEVDVDETIGPRTLSYDGRSNITVTLRGVGANRVVSHYRYYSSADSGAIFTVNSGVTLILDNNITLQGRDDSEVKNHASLVIVNGGTFTMNGGKISGNTASSGGGVYVDNGGTFTMTDGEISGNTANYSGGGVCVVVGTFTMTGGEISGNTNSGVNLPAGTFTMNGGEISGNTASFGGGVNLNSSSNSATFTMNNGKISGNTAYSASGGVHVDSNTTFTMAGGEISGNTASFGGGVFVGLGTFRISTGTIYGSNAGTLSNTAENKAALSGTAQLGTFSGTTWVSAGSLLSTDDTIRVVNGELMQ